jgi:uncharacterized repeat protein (TIGR01451 family)
MQKISSGWGAGALAAVLSLVSLGASGAEVGTYFTQPPGGAYEAEVPGGAGIQVSPNRIRMMADPRGPREARTAIEIVFEGAVGSPLQPKGRIEGDLIYWYSGAIGEPALAVPRFAQLEQENLHPGIDLGIALQRGRIDNRFTLAEGADLSQLRLRIQTRGSQPILSSTGALEVGEVRLQPIGATFIALGEDLYGLSTAGPVTDVRLSIDYAAWLTEAHSAPQPRLADHPQLLAQLPGAKPGDLLVFRTGSPPVPEQAADSVPLGGGTVYTGGDYACTAVVLEPGDMLDPSAGAFTNVLALVVPQGVTVGVAPGGNLLDVTSAYVRIDGTLDLVGAGEAGGAAVPGTGDAFANSPGLAGQGPGAGQGGSGGAFFDEVVGSGGGGYGNLGGAGGLGDEPVGTPGAGGATYGMALPPGIELGSGGASGVANDVGPSGAGGAGGGALDLLGNEIRIGGLIRADGEGGGTAGSLSDSSGGGGGAGGGVLLQASRTLSGNGTVAARGGGGAAGDSFAGGSGGGAGGRIKFAGALDPGSTITSLVGGGGGGSPSIGNPGATGGSGSVDSSTTTPPNPAGANVTVCGQPVAELRLTKSVDNDLVFVGDTVVYTLLVENIGPTTATGITVTDALPAGMSAVSTNGCTNDPNGTVTCQLADLAPGASASYTLTATAVLDPGPGLTDIITNTAVVNLAELDPVLADNESSVPVTVQGAPLVTLTKTGPPTAVAGLSVTYSIEVSNAGPWDALGVVIDDTPPAGLTFNSATGPCAGGFPCAIGTIASGASVQFDVTFDIATSVLGDVTNTANVTASNIPVPDPAVHTDSAITTIQAVAELSIGKTDSVDPVVAGTPLSYTVTVSNAGPSDATAVTVADTLPAGVTLVSTAGCAQDPAGVPTCTLGTVAAGGMAAYTVNVTVDAATPAGVISNMAVVDSAAFDPDTSNNSTTENTTVEAVADLSITKTNGVASSTAGTDTVYTIVVSNAGPSDAPGSTVADAFPAACVGVTWTCTGAGGGTCTTNGSGNINDVVLLPASGSVTYSATCPINPAAVGTLDNTATVAVAGGVTDPDGSNNSASDSDTLEISADVSITKTNGATSSTAGTDAVYTIVASNAGPSNAPGNTVADAFPAACVGVTWTCIGAGGGTCTANGSGNINDGVNLPATGSVTYSATCPINPAAVGTLENTATVVVAGGVTDPSGANNSATDTDSLTREADLSIVLVDSVDPAAPATPLDYSATLSNAGPSTADDVTLELVLDPETHFVSVLASVGASCTTPAVGSSGTLSCTWIGATAVAQSRSLDVSVNVTPSALGTLSATASVSSLTVDPAPENDSVDEFTTLATGTADLLLNLTATPSPVGPGDVLTITASGNNSGPADAQDVEIAIELPTMLGFASVTPGPGGTCIAPALGAGGTVVCTYAGPTPVGATRTVVVAATPVAGGEAIITASAVAMTSDPTPANAQATAGVTVLIAPVFIPTLELRTLLLLLLMMATMGWFALRHER